jgi:hypothetical protein
LLCFDCEQRVSKFGECWVLANCLQKGGITFPLAALLASKTPALAGRNSSTKVNNAAEIPEIDLSALAYFGASIFWRGCIHPWNTDGTIPVNLGPYQEQFRRYLLGNQEFPEHCYLLVAFRDAKELSGLTYPPVGGRQGTHHVYRFPMPGLAFTLLIGRKTTQNLRSMCFVNGHLKPIVFTGILEQQLFDEAIKMYSRNNPHKFVYAGAALAERPIFWLIDDLSGFRAAYWRIAAYC